MVQLKKHFLRRLQTGWCNKVRKQLGAWILPDPSWLVRSGSDNSIMAVNSASTVSPPPHIGHGWLWVEWSGTHRCRRLTFCFLFVIRNIFHTQFESSRHQRVDWDPSWGVCSAPPLQPHWFPVQSNASCCHWLVPPPLSLTRTVWTACKAKSTAFAHCFSGAMSKNADCFPYVPIVTDRKE